MKVSWNKTHDFIIRFFRYYWMSWHVGNEPMYRSKIGWKFKISSGTKGDKTVVKLFKSFIETGLYSKLHENDKNSEIRSESRANITNNIIQRFNEGKRENRNKRKGESPLKLEDSIQTIFIILGGMLIISICSFLMEISLRKA